MAVYIRSGISLGIAQFLRFAQHGRELGPLTMHLGQDEVRGSVDDTVQAFEAVDGQRLAQRMDYRNAAARGGLEVQGDVVLAGQGE